jgi:hypothetical protein
MAKAGKRSAIIIINNNIDAVAIQQVSDEDATLIELAYEGLKFFGANLYVAIDRDIDRDTAKVQEIIQTKGGNG